MIETQLATVAAAVTIVGGAIVALSGHFQRRYIRAGFGIIIVVVGAVVMQTGVWS
ncbi:hypothetical protein [Streptomyces yokosukanensis]|uniref:hypothetical protein n=1 Tax=Streptomyces yokosukanensis TaxID=67386 RepID=UPI00131A8AB9|nr:hypothetical protein [Streptomyces yokosukanensis]